MLMHPEKTPILLSVATSSVESALPVPASGAPAADTQKWLVFGDSGARWPLPDDADLNYLEAVIKAAMRGGEPLTIEVRGDDPAIRSYVVLNGKALGFVVLCEGGRAVTATDSGGDWR
jgi:hypothetical protein